MHRLHVNAAPCRTVVAARRLVTVRTAEHPGAYDPHALTDLAAKASFSHNRMKHAFGSHAAKALELDLFGLGVPGPGTYSIEAAAKKTFPEEDGNRSVFLSGTPQRLTAENLTPSPDTYRPQMTSVYGNLRNGPSNGA